MTVRKTHPGIPHPTENITSIVNTVLALKESVEVLLQARNVSVDLYRRLDELERKVRALESGS